MNEDIVRRIAEDYGTPLYIFFEEEFENNITELSQAYQKVYPKFRAAYSFKTNYMPIACKIAKRLGLFAETVSDLEYHMAKRYGYTPGNIIVNGPGKWNGLREMLSDGALVMLDNLYEAEQVRRIANSLNHPVRIGFRLNFSVGTDKQSRFGFDTENTDTALLIADLRKEKNIRIDGLHYHISGARSIESWKRRAQEMISYAGEYLRKDERKMIDLGSGMFGHLHPFLAAQFNQEIPTFEEYAEMVAGEFRRQYSGLPEDEKPLLVVEPGTTVVANTMVYAAGVIAEKSIRGKNIVMVDGSVHQLGELGRKKKLPLHVIPRHGNVRRVSYADITGYTCLEDDILYRELDREIGPGDILCFENAGAYTNVLKPPFIQAGCAIVAARSNGEVCLVKRRESAEDFLASYYTES